MKAKLKQAYSIDLEHTIIKGAEVEILESWCGCDDTYYRCVMSDGTQRIIGGKLLEITDVTPPTDWKDLRIKAVLAAMQGFCANPANQFVDMDYQKVSQISIKQADALIYELKKNK